MTEKLFPDICVIGAGSAGLTVAAGAAQMGARVVLIERGAMGGDCLNTGCVPSKSLLAAAKRAAAGGARALGVGFAAAEVDFAAVQDHVQAVIDSIAPHDSQERFESLGVTVLREEARFTGASEVTVGNTIIRAKRFVIATGSRPAIPPIKGLEDVPYFTNETIFQNRVRPQHLVVIGGGPIGLEMAQAHRRLGAEVTVIELYDLLPRDDRDAARIVRDRLEKEGIRLLEHTAPVAITGQAGAITITLEGGAVETITGSHLLIATGRRPNIEALDLDAAGIAYTDKGITTDDRLRTANKRVFAIGDVAGRYQFTHMAGYDAGIALRNILFRLPAKARPKAFPWVTYTDPELAQVGLTEAAAKEAGQDGHVFIESFDKIDRARCEGNTQGFLKVIADRKGRILGATCVGSQAGELIQPWILAMESGLKMKQMASFIAPYPTRGEIAKRVAGKFYEPLLFSTRTRRLVRFLLKLP